MQNTSIWRLAGKAEVLKWSCEPINSLKGQQYEWTKESTPGKANNKEGTKESTP
jgi:hypothetical protein